LNKYKYTVVSHINPDFTNPNIYYLFIYCFFDVTHHKKHAMAQSGKQEKARKLKNTPSSVQIYESN